MQRREFLKITGQSALAIALLSNAVRSVRAQEATAADNSAPETPMPAVPDNMQLFLLMGQSNMSGRGAIEAQDLVTDPRIWMMNKEMNWVLAKAPIHFDNGAARVGLAGEFAKTLVANDPNINVGLIPTAVGGTSLDKWKAGDELYTNAVTRAREAMKHGQLAGILWHQGESDAKAAKVATYAERFSAMIAQLRTDLDAENVPVIMGELVPTRAANAGFDAALPAISAAVPLCTWVSSEGLSARKDNIHFDSASQRTLGKRYAAAFLEIQKPVETD